MPVKTICWANNSIKIIDQRKLPGELKYIYCRDLKTIWDAIKTLAVRGAPALGVAAAFGVLLGVSKSKERNTSKFIKEIESVCDYIGTSRPTAVNLFNALNDIRKLVRENKDKSVIELKKLIRKCAFQIYEHDRKVCREMGKFGAKFIDNKKNYMTVCNAGSLATVDFGTALGVFYTAQKNKREFKVYSCETRPLLQGARLTAWELKKSKIDVTLICDNMAASLMRKIKISGIFTGADRIASNGDTANKIGTYNLAVLAKHHKIPFYVVAPFSTFDLNIDNGKQIPIEERKSDEITQIKGINIAPKGIKVYNPAFDVTDHNLITAIITERGVISPVNKQNIKKIFSCYA